MFFPWVSFSSLESSDQFNLRGMRYSVGLCFSMGVQIAQYLGDFWDWAADASFGWAGAAEAAAGWVGMANVVVGWVYVGACSTASASLVLTYGKPNLMHKFRMVSHADFPRFTKFFYVASGNWIASFYGCGFRYFDKRWGLRSGRIWTSRKGGWQWLGVAWCTPSFSPLEMGKVSLLYPKDCTWIFECSCLYHDYLYINFYIFRS